MKKTGKLIILAAVLAVMIVATQAAKSITGKKQAEEENAAEETVIFSADMENVKELSIVIGEDILSFTKTADKWTMTEIPEFPLDGETVEALLGKLKEVRSVKTIEKISDLSGYGLEEPECRITLDGKMLSFGNTQDLDGYVYTSAGDGNVYLVDPSVREAFSTDQMEFLQMEQLPQMTDLVSFHVETPDGEYEIDRLPESGITYSDKYEYFMKDGAEYIALDTSLATALIGNVTQLNRELCVEWNADDDLLKNSGLEEPPITVTIVYTETEKIETDKKDSDGNTIFDIREKPSSFVLKVSGDYARIGDSRMIYRISSGLADKMRYTTAAELLPEDVLALDFTDVVSVDVSVGDQFFTLEKTVETAADENGETDIEIRWKRKAENEEDGIPFSEDFADCLKDMMSSGYAGNTAPGAEEVCLLFHRTDENYPETELKFCRYDSKNCVALIDGDPTVLVSRNDVESLTDLLQSVQEEPSDK
ncbi:MAG: DUF4340 domain-containing protein [Eubacteriales bacterium]|nr:DUF4340 domain-containing protein [Eubacteriales bacterium]